MMVGSAEKRRRHSPCVRITTRTGALFVGGAEGPPKAALTPRTSSAFTVTAARRPASASCPPPLTIGASGGRGDFEPWLRSE
jgi:hypothetical protein